VGGFRTQFKICSDYDFLLRLAERFEADYVDQPLAQYRVHAANMSRRFYHMAWEVLVIRRQALAGRPELRRVSGSALPRLQMNQLSNELTRLFVAENRIMKRLRLGLHELRGGWPVRRGMRRWPG
jgi:hypothetical protein